LSELAYQLREPFIIIYLVVGKGRNRSQIPPSIKCSGASPRRSNNRWRSSATRSGVAGPAIGTRTTPIAPSRGGPLPRRAGVPAREGGHGAAHRRPVDEDHAAGQRINPSAIDTRKRASRARRHGATARRKAARRDGGVPRCLLGFSPTLCARPKWAGPSTPPPAQRQR